MQVHTKKHHTETIELKFIGPIVNMARAIETLKPLGFLDKSDTVPWRETYPECSEAQLIGKALAGADINAEWAKAGRGGKADQPLSVMVKAKKLKRKPLGWKKGSEYRAR